MINIACIIFTFHFIFDFSKPASVFQYALVDKRSLFSFFFQKQLNQATWNFPGGFKPVGVTNELFFFFLVTFLLLF